MDQPRERILTEKAKEERIRRLKNDRKTALSTVARQKTRLTALLIDEENLHLVKTSLFELDELLEYAQRSHELFIKELTSDVDKDNENDHFVSKQCGSLKFRQQVLKWISLAEL